jgi:hypothetical protein
MHPVKDWRIEYTHEIDHATSAHHSGNEGMARVCARRAAGIIIEEYLSRRDYPCHSDSAYQLLTVFLSLPDVDKHTQDIVDHFLLKVDTDHKLPKEIDLINDAKWLAKNLLLETTR